jgi:hypothetical protein
MGILFKQKSHILALVSLFSFLGEWDWNTTKFLILAFLGNWNHCLFPQIGSRLLVVMPMVGPNSAFLLYVLCFCVFELLFSTETTTSFLSCFSIFIF